MPGVGVSAVRPHVLGVEVELLVVVGHGQVDVPQVGDEAFGHRMFLAWVRVAVLRRAG